jgi:hypothetical protein
VTFRPILLTLALLLLVWALSLWWREPPSEKTVFDTGVAPTELAGVAGRYTAARGVPLVRLITPNGMAYFTDCLAMLFVCTKEGASSQTVKVHAVFTSFNRIFWPVSVEAEGRTVVNKEASRQAYALFVEREATLYRFPLALSAAFVVLAIVFGKRTAFG